MSKPNWLIQHEQKKFKPQHAKCCQCVYYKGKYRGTCKYKNKERIELWECKKHGIPNNKYSFACCDWVLDQDAY